MIAAYEESTFNTASFCFIVFAIFNLVFSAERGEHESHARWCWKDLESLQ
uniref:Uncharacterized protein n=1 Tax=Arundo donax TaxID=35708 RepID=A0A0A9H0V7_ARUDO